MDRVQTKNGTDLRVARSLAKKTQGQLAIETRIPAKSIHGWERTGTLLPDWAITQLSNFLEWPDELTIEQQLDRTYIVVLQGLTPWQFEKKREGLGKYVVQAGELNPLDLDGEGGA